MLSTNGLLLKYEDDGEKWNWLCLFLFQDHCRCQHRSHHPWYPLLHQQCSNAITTWKGGTAMHVIMFASVLGRCPTICRECGSWKWWKWWKWTQNSSNDAMHDIFSRMMKTWWMLEERTPGHLTIVLEDQHRIVWPWRLPNVTIQHPHKKLRPGIGAKLFETIPILLEGMEKKRKRKKKTTKEKKQGTRVVVAVLFYGQRLLLGLLIKYDGNNSPRATVPSCTSHGNSPNEQHACTIQRPKCGQKISRHGLVRPTDPTLPMRQGEPGWSSCVAWQRGCSRKLLRTIGPLWRRQIFFFESFWVVLQYHHCVWLVLFRCESNNQRHQCIQCLCFLRATTPIALELHCRCFLLPARCKNNHGEMLVVPFLRVVQWTTMNRHHHH